MHSQSQRLENHNILVTVFLAEPSWQPVPEQRMSSLRALDLYASMLYTAAMCNGNWKAPLEASCLVSPR